MNTKQNTDSMSAQHTPDYAGRGKTALRSLFDGLMADVQEQWRQSEPAPSSPGLPEPMLGEMGAIAKATGSQS